MCPQNDALPDKSKPEGKERSVLLLGEGTELKKKYKVDHKKTENGSQQKLARERINKLDTALYLSPNVFTVPVM